MSLCVVLVLAILAPGSAPCAAATGEPWSGGPDPESASRSLPAPEEERAESSRVPASLPDALTAARGELSGEASSDWQDVRLTARAIGSRLSHPSRRDLLTWGGLAAAAVYLAAHKDDLAGQVRQRRSGETDEFSRAVRPLGEVAVPAAALSVWMLGRLGGSDATRRAGLVLAESAAFTFAATEIGQFVLAEQRPYQGSRLRFFRTGGHGVSGHTSILASTSVPLDRMFLRVAPGDGGWARTLKVLGKCFVYGAPVAVGWSRMNDDVHFAWNVLLGLGTGFITGDLVAEAHGFGPRRSEGRAWSLAPVTDGRGSPGIVWRWSR